MNAADHTGEAMSNETASPTYDIPKGARVRVLVDDERGRRWYAGRIVAHTTIGEAYHPGGYPTYDIATDDGRRYGFCSPECVKAAPSGDPWAVWA